MLEEMIEYSQNDSHLFVERILGSPKEVAHLLVFPMMVAHMMYQKKILLISPLLLLGHVLIVSFYR
jgi:hypothetical protein